MIGVTRSHRGKGLGRRLLTALERWAIDRDVSRLELTVRIDNDPARWLYERMGYRVEGRRRASIVVDGEPIDELAMARLLGERGDL